MSGVPNSIQHPEEDTSLDRLGAPRRPDAPSWEEIIANEQHRAALEREANGTATQEPSTEHKPP